MNASLKFDERGHGMLVLNNQVVFIGDEVAVGGEGAFRTCRGTLSAIDNNYVLVKIPEGNLIVGRDCVLSGRRVQEKEKKKPIDILSEMVDLIDEALVKLDDVIAEEPSWVLGSVFDSIDECLTSLCDTLYNARLEAENEVSL